MLVLETRQHNFVNTLPDEKILGLPKLKAFADDKLNFTLKMSKLSFTG